MGFVDPSPLLVLLVLLPLAWTFAALVAEDESNVSRVAIAGSGGLAALTFALAGKVALAPKGHALAQHLGVVARTGPLDLSIDLWLDPIAAVMAVAVALVTSGATLHTAWSPKAGVRTRLAYSGLLSFAAMLCVVGEGWAPFVVGLQVSTLATFAFSRELQGIPARASIAADLAIVAAGVLLFCGAMAFETDVTPRFSAIPTNEATGGRARLSMTTFAGAFVDSEDGAPLPGEPLRSPFSIDVDPGTYTLRVAPGAASPEVLVPIVTLVAGREHVIVPSGPTASFRVLSDRESIEDQRASSAAIVFAFVALLIRLAAATARRVSRTPSAALAIVPVAVLALRISPLLDPLSARVVAAIAGVTALFLAGNAASSREAPRALVSTLSAAVATSIAAAALGERSAALVLAGVAPLALAGGLAALESKGDVRWLGVACAAATGLLPLSGTSLGLVLTSASALSTGFFGIVLTGVLALAWTLGALACFRVYDAAIRARLRDGSRAQGTVAVALGVAALVLGAVLGAGTSAFGGGVISLAQRAAPGSVVVDPRLSFVGLGVSILSALIGVVLARRLAENAQMLDALGAPSVASGRLAVRVGGIGAFLSRAVYVMDREMVDDFASALGQILTRAADGMRGAERVGGGFISSRFDAWMTEIGLRVGLDHPRRRERVQIAILVAMVAFLALLVLSSFFSR